MVISMKNARTLELCHEWSQGQKAAYNREYYRKNKYRWKNGYDRVDSRGMGDIDERYSHTRNAIANREEQYLRAQKLSVDSTKKHNQSMKNGKQADKMGLPAVAANQYYKAISEAMDARSYNDQAKKTKRDLNALKGDQYMIGSQGYYKYWEHNNRAPQAMVEKKEKKSKLSDIAYGIKFTASELTKRGKKKAERIASSAQKASHAVQSKASKAGKAFIDNWKAGIG